MIKKDTLRTLIVSRRKHNYGQFLSSDTNNYYFTKKKRKKLIQRERERERERELELCRQ